jgi:hypothetical protein
MRRTSRFHGAGRSRQQGVRLMLRSTVPSLGTDLKPHSARFSGHLAVYFVDSASCCVMVGERKIADMTAFAPASIVLPAPAPPIARWKYSLPVSLAEMPGRGLGLSEHVPAARDRIKQFVERAGELPHSILDEFVRDLVK